MYCDKCGAPVRDGAQFCPVCGEVVAAAPQAPVADTDTVSPVPQAYPQPQQVPPISYTQPASSAQQAYLQQVSSEPGSAKVPEPPAMFASKRQGIALIVTSVVWLVLNVAIPFIVYNPYSLFLAQVISAGIALLPAVVLIIAGIREIRWSKEMRTGNGMVGLADIALAVSLLLSGIGCFPLALSGIILLELGFSSELINTSSIFINMFNILGLVIMIIAVIIFILVSINRKKVAQGTAVLWIAITLFMVFALLNILPFVRLISSMFGWRMAILTAGTLVNSIFLAGLIARAVDLFPKRPRATRSTGVPAGGSAGVNPLDEPSGGFAVLCFFVPLVGLILYLVWKSEYPLKARSCGKGAIIGAIISFVLSCLSVVLATVLPLLLMF
jgi:hypothetical protein